MSEQTHPPAHAAERASEVAALEAEIKALQSRPVQASTTVKPADEWWSAKNAMTISTAVLVFGFLVLLLATYLIRMGKNAEAVLRIYGTVLIVVVAVFLVVAGYSNEQIAPVTGLLGTIAGYLLGKETSPLKREGRADHDADAPRSTPGSQA